MKKFLLEFEERVSDFPFHEKSWNQFLSFHDLGEITQRFYFISEHLDYIVSADGMKVGWHTEAFFVFYNEAVFSSEIVAGDGFFHEILILFVPVVGQQIKLLFVKRRMAIGQGDFSQMFDGQENTFFKVVFAEAVLTIARQNIRHDMIVIDAGHTVYGGGSYINLDFHWNAGIL